MKKILFICPYPPGLAPSQRFRFEQYIRQLQVKGFLTVIRPFFTEKAYFTFYQSGSLLSKIRAILQSYWQRLTLLLHRNDFDFIFIHREAAPVGPPFIEWWLACVLKRKVIYDFDDAIWLTDNVGESALEKTVRNRRKVGKICKWSYRVSCGNEYLASYARNYNQNVIVNPTTIDTEGLHLPKAKPKPSNTVTIGWTGSHSTLKYLHTVVPVLQRLERKFPSLVTAVIADRNPELPLKNFRFKRWTTDSEIDDLRQLDIGIMPLPDDEWTQGKCGFKALQYMALQIPAVVSPVGVNKILVEHAKEGYWCTTSEDWFRHLDELISNPVLREQMGKRGREKVRAHYSVTANAENFLSLFTEA